MATILCGVGTSLTIQQAVNQATSSDIVSINAGTYNEALSCLTNKDLKIIPTDGPGTVALDGQKQLAIGINYAAARKLTVWDLELTNYTAYGIKYNSGGTGATGTSGYNPSLVMNPLSTYDIRRNEVHHIGLSTPNSTGNTVNWGIFVNGGYQGLLEENLVHHIGVTNEAMGIVSMFGYKPTIRRNTAFACHKTGIRYGYGYRAIVDSNLVFDCWSGMDHEFQVGSRVSNNLIYDCDWGTYIKQANNNADSNPLVRDFWGSALGLAGAAPSEYVGFWHNTVAACRMVCVGLATQYPMDYVDVRNNLLVGGTYTNAGGVAISAGDAYVQDVGNATLLGPNAMLDYNTYVTAYGQPAFFLTKGQSTPGGTNSAASLSALQAWRSLGWEVHGQVANPLFTDAPNKNFAHSASFTGYNLTTSPINAIGSPYGTQVGADVSLIPSAYADARYVGAPPTVDSSSGWTSPGKSVDLRFLTYTTSPTVSGATGGVGVNQWIIYDLGSAKPFNELRLVASLVDGSQPKTVKVEYSNNKTSWTTAGITPGFDNWANGATQSFTSGGQTTQVMQLLSTVTARYLRLTVVDTWTVTHVTLATFLALLITPNVAPPPPPPPPPLTKTPHIGFLRGRGSAAR